MRNGNYLVLLPAIVLKAIDAKLLRREHDQVQRRAIHIQRHDVENALVLRPERDFADRKRSRFVREDVRVRARNGNQDYGGLICSLMNLCDPDITLQVFRE